MNTKVIEKFTLELTGPDEVPDIVNQLEKGDMLLKARSIHEKFLPEPWLTKLAEDSVKQRVLWRHRDPEDKDKRGFVYGRNIHNVVKDGFIESYYRIFGGKDGTPEDKLQKLIKLKLEAKEPIGISKGFLKRLDKNGDIARVISLEDSITYKPQCERCITQEVLVEMEEKELKEQIEKLTQELDNTKMQLETTNEQLESKDTEIETIKSEFSVKLEAIETKVGTKDAEKEQFEEKYVKLKDEFNTFKITYEAEKKQPYIDELYKLEKDDDLLEIYPTWDEKKLAERLVKKKLKANAAKVMITSLEEEKMKVEKELYEKDVGLQALKGWNPEYIKIMENLEAQDKAMRGGA